jgi:hypothetical protein
MIVPALVILFAMVATGIPAGARRTQSYRRNLARRFV